MLLVEKQVITGDIKLPAFLNGLQLKAKHTNVRQFRIKTTANSGYSTFSVDDKL